MGEFIRDRVPDWLTYAGMHGIKVEGQGSWRSILCDFHDDKHASLRINTKSGGWCCMSCSASGGDTLSHYMQMTGLDFVAAAEMLGAWDGDANASRPLKARRLPARDALELIESDLMIASLVLSQMLKGIQPESIDQTALTRSYRNVLLVLEEVRG